VQILDKIQADPKLANSIQYILLHFLGESLIKANVANKEFLIWNFARGLPMPNNVKQLIETYGKYKDVYFLTQGASTSESKKKIDATKTGEFGPPPNRSVTDALKRIDSYPFGVSVRPSLTGMFKPQMETPQQGPEPANKMGKKW
jgi:hypothetical protein